MNQEKQIGGQIELVRFQAQKVVDSMSSFAHLMLPTDTAHLQEICNRLRLCASEVENLKEMLDEYRWVQCKNEIDDSQRPAEIH